MPRGVKFSDEVKEEAVRRLRAGDNVYDVSRELGVTVLTLNRWVAEAKARAVEEEVEAAEEEIAEAVEEEGDPELERDFALAILEELDAEICPKMLRTLLRAAKKVLG